MPTLALMAEIEEIPASLVGATNMVIRTVKGRLVCASNKISIKDNREIYVILLRDATVMVAKKIRTLGKNTFIGKAVWKSLLKTLTRPYKWVMTLKAEQFRSISFIHCRRKAKAKEKSPLPLERTPFCCWKVREERGDADWFVKVNTVEMEFFATCLLEMLTTKISN
ncbi:hypothetical protein OSTOST_19811, partial [Ostertagia ostertagi]